MRATCTALGLFQPGQEMLHDKISRSKVKVVGGKGGNNSVVSEENTLKDVFASSIQGLVILD